MLAWIEAILGEKLPAGAFEEVLKDGIILCKLIQKLMPGSVPKINTSGGQFKFMENINHFQTACRRYGVPDVDVFQTVDLYEKRNIPAVTQCIMALGRTCYLHPEFKGPFLGPKVSLECDYACDSPLHGVHSREGGILIEGCVCLDSCTLARSFNVEVLPGALA